MDPAAGPVALVLAAIMATAAFCGWLAERTRARLRRERQAREKEARMEAIRRFTEDPEGRALVQVILVRKLRESLEEQAKEAERGD